MDNKLYNKFKLIASEYLNKKAINDITYGELMYIVDSQEYNAITDHSDHRVIIDILVAAKFNKPLVIPPKDKKDFFIPSNLPESFTIILYTSGSTSGIRKPIEITEKMILANALNSIEAHMLNSDDVIYNVFSMNHTGSINGQVLPGLLVGASVIIEDFDPFKFFRRLNETKTTITHLVPKMLASIRKVKPTSVRFITAGSDCIKREYVEPWVKMGIPFMINYGMSEAGPIAINHIFRSVEELSIFDNGIPLGDVTWCDVKVNGRELMLRGDIVVTGDDWLATGDCVSLHDNWIMYHGRLSADCAYVPKRY